MAQQVYDIDTVGYGAESLGGFFDFYINNTFYLLAPEYYYSFYSVYLRRCLSVYDGWVGGFHNLQSGLVPQRMLQSVASGLNNMLFAHGIDFKGKPEDYEFAVNWAKKSKFYTALKKCHKFAIGGGTSVLKLNRADKDLYVTGHRIDTCFADFDGSGKIISCKFFFDAIHDTNANNRTLHYGICEERYFNEQGKPCTKASVYVGSANLQTETQARPKTCCGKRVNWCNLPLNVKQYIKVHYPSIMLDEEQYLPFSHSLGCYTQRFTDDIPQIPNTPFGQPIGDILFTESFQYDQMKYFEKNEVDLARARALIPEQMWNKDDPAYDSRALNERFYQKVSSSDGDNDKVTPIQFMLRGNDIRAQKENIFKDIAFKLNISASSVASFLSEGEGAKTATEVVSERTKSDTWIDGQINLNAPDINELLKDVMYYYNHNAVEILYNAEDQSPFLDKLKTNSDVYSAGNMSARRFVKDTYKHLSQAEQKDEIEYLEQEKNKQEALATANVQLQQSNDQKMLV